MTSAVLLKDVAIWVRNVSTGGCLFESSAPLPVGTIGELEMELEGKRRVEWFRVCRVGRLHPDGAYIFGAEFLPFAVAGGESLRGLVGRAVPGPSDGMPGLAGRSSSDPGNSIATGKTVERPAVGSCTESTAKVVDFGRRPTRTDAGSEVALPRAAAHEECADRTKEREMKKLIAHLVWDDQGQDLIEYVLIGSFVSIAVLVAATALGTNLNTWYQSVADWVAGAAALVP